MDCRQITAPIPEAAFVHSYKSFYPLPGREFELRSTKIHRVRRCPCACHHKYPSIQPFHLALTFWLVYTLPAFEMLVIRLQRTGRENTPTYRMVVAQHQKPVKGKFLEIVGHYLPARDPVIFEHKDERINFWIDKGAIPSNTVARLLKKNGAKNMDKYIQRYAKRRNKKAPVEEVAAPAAPAAPAAEASVAESGDKPAA